MAVRATRKGCATATRSLRIIPNRRIENGAKKSNCEMRKWLPVPFCRTLYLRIYRVHNRRGAVDWFKWYIRPLIWRHFFISEKGNPMTTATMPCDPWHWINCLHTFLAYPAHTGRMGLPRGGFTGNACSISGRVFVVRISKFCAPPLFVAVVVGALVICVQPTPNQRMSSRQWPMSKLERRSLLRILCDVGKYLAILFKLKHNANASAFVWMSPLCGRETKQNAFPPFTFVAVSNASRWKLVETHTSERANRHRDKQRPPNDNRLTLYMQSALAHRTPSFV